MILKDTATKQRSLAFVMGLLLVVAFSLAAVVLFLQTYSYAKGAVNREIQESFRQLHHALQLTLDYRLKALQHNINVIASDIQASRFLEQRDYGHLERLLAELDATNPESSADIRFIAVEGKVAWADMGVEFYGLENRLDQLSASIMTKHRWYLLEVHPSSPAHNEPHATVVLLLRKAPMVSPVNGKVLGYLFGGMVLSDNLVLAQSLRAATHSEAIGIAFNRRWLITTAAVDSGIEHLLSASLPPLNEVTKLSRELLVKGRSVRIEDQPSGLAFYSVVKNDVFATVQGQYVRGGLLALAGMVILSLVVTWMLRRTILKPLLRLVTYTNSIDTGLGQQQYQRSMIAEFNLVGQALQRTAGILIEKERSLQELFDYAFSPIIVWDPQLRVVQFNQAATLLLSVSQSSALANPVTRLFPEAAAESLLKATAGEVIQGLELASDNGQIILWNMAPLLIDGKVKAVIAQGLDVTTLKRAERQSHQARLAAEASTRAKSAFLATVSHEIRTPMNGILGMVELLRETPLSQPQQEYVDVLRDSGRALLTILNDILDFSKIEAGKMDLTPSPCNLRRLLGRQVRQFRPGASAKELVLSLDFPAAIPANVIADCGRVAQVVGNLLGNAIKFTEHGEIRLWVECLQNTGEQVELRINVQDTGIGISREGQRRLFQSFSQVDASASGGLGGTGLGLAICRQLVTLMGGSIGVESNRGNGARFWFTLALPLCQEWEVVEADATDMQALPLTGQPMKVLLVEDNLVNQKIARIMLEKRGCIVSTAENGKQALEMINRKPFSMVFMDCQMPVMDGYETTRRIRQREAELRACRLPVVAMTANTTDGERQRCLRAGMDDYISKPVDGKKVLRALLRWGPKARANS